MLSKVLYSGVVCVFLFAFGVVPLTVCAQTNNQVTLHYPQLDSLADSIKKQYIADKRLDVFDVQVSDKVGQPMLLGVTTNQQALTDYVSKARELFPSLIDSTLFLDNDKYGVVTISVADMRVNSDFDYEMATQSLLGTPIDVLQKRGSWSRVRTPDGYISWVQNISFAEMDGKQFNEWITAKKIIFTDYTGFSYQATDTKSQHVSDLVSGNILKYEGDAGKYYSVSYPDGRKAYVLKEQAAIYNNWLSSLQLSEQSIVDRAKTYMGIPYVWGGTSVKGMDCSGFTKTVLFMHGVILMRDASQQVNTGTPVDISQGYDNLKVGDLLFFGKKAVDGKKERIRHVAFYLGNNKFIHASGFIRINSLNPADPDYDEHNTKEFVRASRVIGAVGSPGIWSIKDNAMYNKVSEK